MRRSLRTTFSRPERPTLTSRSLQSITRPFQKRFREVFGNARILIFYFSIEAWEEKSSPKPHLGWFFLVFGEGKPTKENISIFWFIWFISASGGIRDLNSLKSSLACKILDSMISPIPTYNSEVWGAFVKSDSKSWDSSAIEKTHLQFCKRYCYKYITRHPTLLVELNSVNFP